MLQFFRYLLFPFSIIYKVITTLRNLLFDLGILKSISPDLPSIGVGNLTVGGTGKTPVVDYLIEKLKKDNQITVISRGYGRKTKGLREITSLENPETVGDEPFMLYEKHQGLSFIVSESRKKALEYLKKKESKSDLIIFDDVLQHRHVKPKTMIMLSDFSRPFYEDVLLPTGNLRESRIGAKRANIVLVSKCPIDLDTAEKENIRLQISKYSNAEIYFSQMESTLEKKTTNTELTQSEKVILVSGLANNKQFFDSIANRYQIQFHYKYPDHFQYSESEISEILKSNLPIITTEKDFVKIKKLIPRNSNSAIYVSKIMLKIENEAGFWDSIRSKLK